MVVFSDGAMTLAVDNFASSQGNQLADVPRLFCWMY